MRLPHLCLAACVWSVFAALSAFPSAAQPSAAPKPATPVQAAAFTKAMQEEDAVDVRKALKANPALANAPLVFAGSGTASTYHLPLSLTAFLGNTQIAALLIRAGAKVNAAEQDGETALDEAAYFSNEKMAALLLAHGADVRHRNNVGQTALHQAVAGDDPATVALLLDHGADANAHDKQGATPLGRALGLHCRASVVALLRRHEAKE